MALSSDNLKGVFLNLHSPNMKYIDSRERKRKIN